MDQLSELFLHKAPTIYSWWLHTDGHKLVMFIIWVGLDRWFDVHIIVMHGMMKSFTKGMRNMNVKMDYMAREIEQLNIEKLNQIGSIWKPWKVNKKSNL